MATQQVRRGSESEEEEEQMEREKQRAREMRSKIVMQQNLAATNGCADTHKYSERATGL